MTVGRAGRRTGSRGAANGAGLRDIDGRAGRRGLDRRCGLASTAFAYTTKRPHPLRVESAGKEAALIDAEEGRPSEAGPYLEGTGGPAASRTDGLPEPLSTAADNHLPGWRNW